MSEHTSPSTAPSRGYLQQPTIARDRVCFVAEDDLWVVDAGGGTASRLTVSVADIARPALSPDGEWIAFTAQEFGDKDVYRIAATGGPATRLTYMGVDAVLGWTPAGEVCAASAAGQPFHRPSGRHGGDHTWAYEVPGDGGPPERLAFGPVSALAFGDGGAMALGRNGGDPAWWKRYRGGTAGQVWVRPGADAAWRRLFAEIAGNLVCPMLVGGRVYFLSDHEGTANVYSADIDGTGLRRHSHHDDFYARSASTDGARIVYQQGADIWLLDQGADQPVRLDIVQQGPRPQRARRLVEAEPNLGEFDLNAAGDSLAIGVRGKPFTLALFDGPVRTHGVPQGVRYRLLRWCGPDAVVALSDDGGEDRIEIHPVDGGDRRVLEVDGVSNLVDLVPSPDGSRLALATLDRRLLVVTVEDGTVRELDASAAGWIDDLTWSPDGTHLAYSHPASSRTRSIRICAADGGEPVAVGAPEFYDYQPRFDPTGTWLAFLSKRVFDPVPDGVLFSYGFPRGARPYVVTLAADTPSPLRPAPRGMGPAVPGAEAGASDAPPAAAGDAPAPPAPPAMRLDPGGIAERIEMVDVPEGRYVRLEVVGTKLLLLGEEVRGQLGTDWTKDGVEGSLECYDLAEQHHEVLAGQVSGFCVSADGSTLVARTDHGLRAMAAGQKPPEHTDHDPPGRRSGWIDLGRLRVDVEPGAEWRQMMAEAWRLQRDRFWDPHLSGIDWDEVGARYLPLVERVATRAELSDLIWEMQGELGTSHAYELGGDRRQPPPWQSGRLGADLVYDAATGRWQVAHIVRADSWDPGSSSALVGPGVAIGEGDAVLAVDGLRLDREHPPGWALANRAGRDVELTVAGAGGGEERRVVVRTLKGELAGRYREWVSLNRALVHERSGGRAGYVHIPDMGVAGFSEFHRAYLAEGEREALVIDVRHNGGGNVSALLLAKIAIPRLGEAVSRWLAPEGYPEDSVLGPMVAVADEWAGSDGDIFTNAFKALELGPIVGTRTWGGVVGIEPQVHLVDGTITTQPEYAFWFADAGWGIENHGVDPDHEVVITPEDWADGRDPQLDRAVELVLAALDERPPVRATRPR